MNVEHINPFIEACRVVLKQVIGVEAALGKVFVKSSPYSGEAVIIIVGITGDLKGQAVLSQNYDTAKSVASMMMGGMPIDELTELSRSAISELGNMILGTAASFLSQKKISVDITPPTILTGEGVMISSDKMVTVCIPLTWDNGSKSIELDISVS
ncbi:MAG: chemotaxis protein CheX [Symbiobacteriaceae bacterium]|nr:chemotaxis protein CheX [Symbiobacteriaceae bacterium]